MKLKSILLEAEMDQIEKTLNQAFGDALRDLTNSAKSQTGELKVDASSVEEGQLDEAIGAMAIIGVLLAMPRVVELMAKPISKFIKLSRKLLKSKSVQEEKAVAEAIIEFAHKWHHAYVKTIKWILNASGTFKKAGITTEDQKEKAANLVYYIIIATLAVTSGLESIHAFKELAHAGFETGTLSMTALESALASLKTQEVAKFVKKLIA